VFTWIPEASRLIFQRDLTLREAQEWNRHLLWMHVPSWFHKPGQIADTVIESNKRGNSIVACRSEEVG
jgi:hypothetical protein